LLRRAREAVVRPAVFQARDRQLPTHGECLALPRNITRRGPAAGLDLPEVTRLPEAKFRLASVARHSRAAVPTGLDHTRLPRAMKAAGPPPAFGRHRARASNVLIYSPGPLTRITCGRRIGRFLLSQPRGGLFFGRYPVRARESIFAHDGDCSRWSRDSLHAAELSRDETRIDWWGGVLSCFLPVRNRGRLNSGCRKRIHFHQNRGD